MMNQRLKMSHARGRSMMWKHSVSQLFHLVSVRAADADGCDRGRPHMGKWSQLTHLEKWIEKLKSENMQ